MSGSRRRRGFRRLAHDSNISFYSRAGDGELGSCSRGRRPRFEAVLIDPSVAGLDFGLVQRGVSAGEDSSGDAVIVRGEVEEVSGWVAGCESEV